MHSALLDRSRHSYRLAMIEAARPRLGDRCDLLVVLSSISRDYRYPQELDIQLLCDRLGSTPSSVLKGLRSLHSSGFLQITWCGPVPRTYWIDLDRLDSVEYLAAASA